MHLGAFSSGLRLVGLSRPSAQHLVATPLGLQFGRPGRVQKYNQKGCREPCRREKLLVVSCKRHSFARLVELISNYYKFEIGQKLVDHFCDPAVPKTLCMPNNIMRASIKQVRLPVPVSGRPFLTPTAQRSSDKELNIMAAIMISPAPTPVRGCVPCGCDLDGR